MIRQKVIETLAAEGPRTIAELSVRLGIPRPVLRTALTAEFFNQVEIDHPNHGRVTAWTPRPSVITVDGDGRYAVAIAQVPA